MATTTPAKGKGRRKRSRPTKVVILRQNIVLKDPEIVCRWSSVGTSKGLKTDTEIATFLLSVYDERREESGEGIDPRCHCKGPITLVCLKCRRLPLSGSSLPSAELPAMSSVMSLTPLPAKQRSAANSKSKPASRKIRARPQVKSKKQQIAACDSIKIKQEQTTDVVAEGKMERKTNSVNSDRLNGVGTTSVMNDIHVEDNENQSDADGVDSERESFDAESATEDTGQSEESKAREEQDWNPAAGGKRKRKKRSAKRAFVCPLCRVVFSTNAQCKTHIGEHQIYVADEKGDYNCSACLKTFADFESLYKHLRLTEAQQTCGECQQVFTSRCQIARHAAQHQSRFCARCDKSFPAMTPAGFLRHVRAHGEGDKPTVFLCPQCGKVYKSTFDLKAHMSYHQKDSPFRCSFPPCSKAFKNKSCQRQHELTHKEKSQQCEVCGAKFSRKCRLTRHMQTHFGKRFQCGECQRKYYSASELERHTLIVHQGVRRFECNLCDVKCFLYATMQKHMRIHSGEKPFQCQECQASFTVKATLVKHMRRHTGEKPYNCDDCNQKYSCLASYKRHRQRYHSDSLLTCHCGLKFAAEISLAFHVRMYHDDMVKDGDPASGQKLDDVVVAEKADSRMDFEGLSSDVVVKDADQISGQTGDGVTENSESRIFYDEVPVMVKGYDPVSGGQKVDVIAENTESQGSGV